MPLLALDTLDGDAVIDLTQVGEGVWAEIWRGKTGDRLRCRACGQPLHAKQRAKTGLRFFAHTHVVPDCPTHGESARHLQLKAAFAAAFREAGWSAELEAAGDAWRADVLVSRPDGERTAVEVQLASIAEVDANDRSRRHAASGVQTLWVVAGSRPRWAEQFPAVLLDGENRVAACVLTPAEPAASQPRLADPASIRRFVERYAEGRLLPAPDPEGYVRRASGDTRRSFVYFQLDGCWDEYADRRRREEAERAAAALARMEAEARQRQADLDRRADAIATMKASLAAFEKWFAPRAGGYRAWYGAKFLADFRAAAEAKWDPEVGVVICLGPSHADGPTQVFALAEPHRSSPNRDDRVGAWVSGLDPSADPTGFENVYTPSSTQEPPFKMKPLKRRRRR